MIFGITLTMRFMTPYRRGDILLIPFPFTDFSTFKQRPSVVISSNGFNRIGKDVIIAAITSHMMSPRRAPHEYRLSDTEQKQAGLPLPSKIKLGKIVTIDTRLIRKRLGALPPASTKRISANLQNIFQ